MKSYDPPPNEDAIAELTVDGAKDQLAALNAQFAADLDHHPAVDKAHPQHEGYRKYHDALLALTIGDKNEKKAEEDAEKIRRLEAGDTPAQAALRKQAEKEIARLTELGFTEADVPENVEPHVVRALRLQRLNAEGDVDHLTPLLEKELTDLRAPSSALELLRSFRQAGDLDQELRSSVFEQLISYIHRANVQRYGKKPTTPKTEDQDHDNDLEQF